MKRDGFTASGSAVVQGVATVEGQQGAEGGQQGSEGSPAGGQQGSEEQAAEGKPASSQGSEESQQGTETEKSEATAKDIQIDESEPAAGPLADVDFNAVFTEFSDNQGQLSEETTKNLVGKLDKAGLPGEETLNTYLEGLRAIQSQNVNTAHEVAGGKEQFEAARDWARQNLSKDEIQAYNDAISSGNRATIRLATEGLVSRHRQATGATGGQNQKAARREPAIGRQGSPSASSGGPFETRRAVAEAMADPRYHSDPDYRQSVIERVRASIQQ